MSSYSNIGIVLDLKPESNILICGSNLNNWYKSFIEIYRNSILKNKIGNNLIKEEKYYDLVLFNTENLKTNELRKNLSWISSILKTNGHLVTIVNNRFCLKNIIKKYLLRKKIEWSYIAGRRLKAHYKSLIRSGFYANNIFASLTSSRDYENLVSINVNNININKLFKINFLNDKYLFVSRKKDFTAIDKLNQKIFKHIEGEKEYNSYLVIDKIEFRSRGALILSLKNKKTNEELILRSSQYKHSKIVIERNAQNIDELCSFQALPNELKDKIPKQFGSIEYASSRLYIEKYIKGRLAWQKIKNSKIEKNIFSNACDFAIGIERATKRNLIMTQELFDKMYRIDFEEIIHQNHISSMLKSIYFKLIKKLEERMIGKRQIIVWSHGDFGYGNIIVGANGEINGVIDWDAARRYRIAGYTIFNLIFTRKKILDKMISNDQEVLQKIGNKCLSCGKLIEERDYENEFNIGKNNIGNIISTFCIIWILYGARYKSGYDEGYSKYFLNWALDNCF